MCSSSSGELLVGLRADTQLLHSSFLHATKHVNRPTPPPSLHGGLKALLEWKPTGTYETII